MAKKLRFDIDPDDKNHEIKEVDSNKLNPLNRLDKFDKSKHNVIKEEDAKIIFSKDSPGCVTLIFRGVPYQV
jgi:hypothetical protein